MITGSLFNDVRQNLTEVFVNVCLLLPLEICCSLEDVYIYLPRFGISRMLVDVKDAQYSDDQVWDVQ